jgi:surface polysaccharide O-acyltransferase-like enzyme
VSAGTTPSPATPDSTSAPAEAGATGAAVQVAASESAVGLPAGAPAAPRRQHLYAIDVVRLLTVAGVVAVHTTSNVVGGNDLAGGAVLNALHVTREVFIGLTAFVLAYQYRGRTFDTRAFWRRRYPLVVAPYAMWSLIYLFADGEAAKGPLRFVGQYAVDLLSAGARYHLYFLLITLQMYLVFPWILRVVADRPRWHARLVAGAFTFELLFTAAAHWRWTVPQPLQAWVTHPGTWAPSYVFYIVLGVVGALHLEAVLAWARDHGRLIAVVAVTTFAAGAALYFAEVEWWHMRPLQAGEVFQPTIVVESVAAVALQLAIGVRVAARAQGRTLGRLKHGSDISFGVYLAHPLLLQGMIAAAAGLGLDPALSHLSGAPGEVVDLVVIVPVLLLVTSAGIELLRRTPLSLVFTGRPARRRLTQGTVTSPNSAQPLSSATSSSPSPLPAPAPCSLEVPAEPTARWSAS